MLLAPSTSPIAPSQATCADEYDGGGIYNDAGTVSITNSTFSGNNASSMGSGGGIYNSNSGAVIIANSTFSGNKAGIDGIGGGIYNYGTATITNSTFSGNSAGFGGNSIYNYFGTATIANTILANSASGSNCSGNAIIDGGNNIDSGTACNFGSTKGSLSSTNPQIGKLTGKPAFFPLLVGSPAIDHVTYNVPNGCPATDQRGVTRPQGMYCDIGAYEYLDTVAPTVDTFTATSPATSLDIPITTFTATDNLAVTGYLITQSSVPPAASDPGWSGTAPTSYYTVAADGTYNLYPWAKDAFSNVSVVYGSPAAITVTVASPTPHSFTRHIPAASSTSADSLVFRATFSEAVQNVDTTDFAVYGTTTAGITNVSAVSTSLYNITVSGGNLASFNGVVGLNLAAGQNITDLVDNSLPSGEPVTDETYTVFQPKERLKNGGFNIYNGTSNIPTSWVKSATFATTDGKDTKVKKEGVASVRMTGVAGKTKTLTQTLALSGVAGDQFIFTFWVRGSVLPAAGPCQAKVMLYNGTTLKLTKFIACPTGTYTTFKKKTLTFYSNAVYSKAVIQFLYSKASGTIWFDGVSLMR
jgi:hypothetical protein